MVTTKEQGHKYFLLEGTTIVPWEPERQCCGRCTFNEWFRVSSQRRAVKQDVVGRKLVTTLFRGMHRSTDGLPMFFETSIILVGSDYWFNEQVYQDRCSTYAEALAMHREALEFANGTRCIPRWKGAA
jgi:hypothetical protein